MIIIILQLFFYDIYALIQLLDTMQDVLQLLESPQTRIIDI